MIKVTFYKRGEDFSGIMLSGHSGYAEEGADIVCSAVSSAVYMTVNTATEIIGTKADIELEDGYLKFIPEKSSEELQLLFKGLALHLNALAQQYDKFICCKEKLLKNNTEV